MTTLKGADDHAVHSFAEEECSAFCAFINSRLGSDTDLAHLLPLEKPGALFEAVSDGMLLGKLAKGQAIAILDDKVVLTNGQAANYKLLGLGEPKMAVEVEIEHRLTSDRQSGKQPTQPAEYVANNSLVLDMPDWRKVASHV